MSDSSSLAERYRYLAEECRRLAATTRSSQMRRRYLLMAEDYLLLADIKERGRLAERAIKDSIRSIDSSLLLRSAPSDDVAGRPAASTFVEHVDKPTDNEDCGALPPPLTPNSHHRGG